MGPSELYINHINPSPQNAKDVIDLRYRDMRRAGLPESRAIRLANSKDKGQVEQQIISLENYPERYLGAIAISSGNLIGYSNTSEMIINDMLPYCNIIEKFALKSLIKFTGNRINGRPHLIHELVVDDTPNRLGVLELLIDRAIECAESSEIYTAAYRDRTLLYALELKRFQLTSKRKINPDGPKKLFVRPLSAPESDFGYKKGLDKLWERA